MQIDRMQLADLGEPEQLAEAIINQIPDLLLPVPVEDIGGALDITDIETLEAEGFEAGLIAFADKSQGVILINERSGHQRRRFSIGHELGHFVNPWHKPKAGDRCLCTSADMHLLSTKPTDRAAQMEVEANRFSSALLLPQSYFQKDLRRMAGADLDHILRLAHKYDMSKEATARRYVHLHDEPCAVVFSHNDRVRYPYRNAAFPYLDINCGDSLPAGSLSARADGSQGKVSDWEQVDAGIWIANPRRRSAVLEQTIAQQNGYRMTLLTLDDEAPAYDEADGEEDLESAWTPRFRK